MVKKFILLIGIILLFFIATFFVFKNGTIEEIININFNDIAYIKTGDSLVQNSFYDVDKFTKSYKNIKYKRVFGSYNSNYHTYYVCYDSNNNILFTLVETENENKVIIKKGKFDISFDSNSLYQEVVS